MMIMGLDVWQPRSFLTRWRMALFMGISTTLTILVMYLLPGLFEFKIMTWQNDSLAILLITFMFLLSMLLLGHAMRYPVLIRRMWRLFEE
jgi:uncharacterized BrkB/YihY/UPF0761 family membrane protein